jgi:hypothetical protein
MYVPARLGFPKLMLEKLWLGHFPVTFIKFQPTEFQNLSRKIETYIQDNKIQLCMYCNGLTKGRKVLSFTWRYVSSWNNYWPFSHFAQHTQCVHCRVPQCVASRQFPFLHKNLFAGHRLVSMYISLLLSSHTAAVNAFLIPTCRLKG